MNYQSTAEALRTYVLPLWGAAAYSAIPLRMENRTVADVDATTTVVQMEIIPLDRQIVGFGPQKLWRTFGEIVFDIKVPNNTGDAVARGIADVLGTILEGKSVSGISLRNALYLGEVFSDGKHTTYQLRVSYDVDELKA